MRAPLDRVWDRIGRRGSTLLMLAFIDAVYSYALFNPAPESLRTPAIVFFRGFAPLWVYGLLWAVAGVMCFVCAFLRSDRWGFAAAMAIKVLWALLYVLALFAGVPRAYISVALWLGIAGWVYTVSTWPEFPRGSR